MGPSMCWNCPSYFCSSIYLMSGHICYIPFSLKLDSRCEVVIPHSKWVGSGRVTLRYVFPAPPSRNRQPRSSTVTLRCTRTWRLSAPRAVALRHGLRVTEAQEGSRGGSGGRRFRAPAHVWPDDSCLSAHVLRDTPPRTRTEGPVLSTLVRHLL